MNNMEEYIEITEEDVRDYMKDELLTSGVILTEHEMTAVTIAVMDYVESLMDYLYGTDDEQ